MAHDHIARNDASRERLRLLLDRCSDDDLQRQVEGWSIAVTLLHLAFWDRFTMRRWALVDADGSELPPSLGQPFTDLINDSAVDVWAGVAPAVAREAVLAAADACDGYVAGLSDAVVAAALAGGMGRALDRSIHRAMHLDPVEAALAG